MNRARYQVRSFREVFLQRSSLSLGNRAGSLHCFPEAGRRSGSRTGIGVMSAAPALPVWHWHLWEGNGSQILSPVKVQMLWKPGLHHTWRQDTTTKYFGKAALVLMCWDSAFRSLWTGEAQLTSLQAAKESFLVTSTSLSLPSIITRQKQRLLVKINKAHHHLIRMDWI